MKDKQEEYVKCTHPNHNDEEDCQDRAVGCSPHCICCMAGLAVPKESEQINFEKFETGITNYFKWLEYNTTDCKDLDLMDMYISSSNAESLKTIFFRLGAGDLDDPRSVIRQYTFCTFDWYDTDQGDVFWRKVSKMSRLFYNSNKMYVWIPVSGLKHILTL